jgi:ATP-binding cassette, subfamily B, bacterial MsbA
MKNFLRALKYSWAYRRRLLLSIFCACIAAALWGLNLTAVYPVLKMLTSKQTLQTWVDKQIDELDRPIDFYSHQLADKQEELKKVQTWDNARLRDEREHALSGEIAGLESRLEGLRTAMWRYQQAKKWVIRPLPNDCFQTLVWLLVIVVVVVAVKGVFEFFQEYLVGSVMNRSLYDLRNRFFRNTIRQDMRQFSDGGTADMMARFTNDMELLGNGMKILYGRLIAEPLRAVSCMLIALWISWQLTLTFLVLVPSSLYIMTKASRMMKKATRRLLERMSSIYKILQETFRGLRVVKAFTMEPYERRRFNAATRDYCERSMRVVTIDALAGPLVELLGVAAVSISILAGAYLVLNGKTHFEFQIFALKISLQMCSRPIDPETLIQLYALLGGMADPVRKLSSVYTKLQSSSAAADRIFAYMDKVPQVDANSTGPRLARHTDAIELRNICFSYQKGQTILENVTLRVIAGETIAIVGPNGCGKTTLLNLLPRFFDPDHGSIVIDGIDVRTAHLRSLRKQIGIVTQDSIIFDDTIYNNISYGNRAAGKEKVEEAAKKAFAHDFIVTFPNGYDTLLGEIGRELSGGERQRIALARAILRDPSILILDEFTSQVDPLSEQLINQAMKEFKRGRTTFMVTHKMHTLELADRIVVLSAGHIEAVGTHTELLSRSVLYRSLQEAVAVKTTAINAEMAAVPPPVADAKESAGTQDAQRRVA